MMEKIKRKNHTRKQNNIDFIWEMLCSKQASQPASQLVSQSGRQPFSLFIILNINISSSTTTTYEVVPLSPLRCVFLASSLTRSFICLLDSYPSYTELVLLFSVCLLNRWMMHFWDWLLLVVIFIVIIYILWKLQDIQSSSSSSYCAPLLRFKSRVFLLDLAIK